MKAVVKLIIRDEYTKKDGTAQLALRVMLDGQRVRFPLDLSWSVAHFDAKAGVIKPRTRDDQAYADTTLIIQGKVADLNEIFTHYRLAKKVLTVEQLQYEYLHWKQRLDFYAFWEREMKDRLKRKKIEDSTHTCHKASLSKLRQFKPRCTFAELTPKLLENFRAWMKSKLGNMPSTVEKTMKDVRTYVNLAVADHVAVDNPFKVVKVKHIETIPDVLTLDQVKQLLELYKEPDLPAAWYVVLQHSLFSCFTGLRISDINRVRSEHLIDGHLVFPAHKNRNKTQRTVSIPLHPMAQSFLTGQVGRLFETFSDQYARRVLKDVGKHLEWNVKMGTHIFRHTFGTNFIELGGDVVTLKEYMGHRKIQTTMQYVHLSERRKREQIRVFDYFNN